MLTIKTNVKEFINTEIKSIKKQIDFAKIMADTNTAKDVRKGLIDEMEDVFNNPTPFTKKGVLYKKASKQMPNAKVFLNDFVGKGNAPVDYLLPHIKGGPRPHKKFEKWLIEKGLMNSNMFAVPAQKARKNKYGNVSAGLITQILSGLGANPEIYSNTTPTSRKRNKKLPEFFVVKDKSTRLFPGIWQRAGKNTIKPVLLFVSAPVYRKRFYFYKVAMHIAETNYKTNYNKAFNYAMRTRKK